MSETVLNSLLAVGHYTVRPGHVVYINDSSLLLQEDGGHNMEVVHQRDREVLIHLFYDPIELLVPDQPGAKDMIDQTNLLLAYTGHFGSDLSVQMPATANPSRVSRAAGSVLYRDHNNPSGCTPHTHSFPDGIIVVDRGDCTFLEKLVHARSALAAGIVVISNDDDAINPTANKSELAAAGDLDDVAILLLAYRAGQILLDMLDTAEGLGIGPVKLALSPERKPTAPEPIYDRQNTEKAKSAGRILYLNGHALLNTRLLI